MQTRSIAPEKWQGVFDSLSRVYDGSWTTLEVDSDDIGAQKELEEKPLRGISYDASGIELHFTARDGTHLVHTIPNPKQVMIEERDDGLIAAIEIEAKDEPRTILHFSSPKALAAKLIPEHAE